MVYGLVLAYLFVYSALNYVPENIPKKWGARYKRGLRFYAFTIEVAQGLMRVIKEGAQVPYTLEE